MMRKLKTICLIFVLAFTLLSLVGCSKTLKEGEYRISNYGNHFTVNAYLTEGESAKSAKVKIKYTYTDENALIKTKTKTETFEVENTQGVAGYFSGSFSTEHPVSEYECKSVVIYYGDSSGEAYISVPMAILFAIVLLIVCTGIWFIIPIPIYDDSSLAAAGWPFVIAVLGMLVTGQWIQALIFLIGLGAWAALVNFIREKLA